MNKLKIFLILGLLLATTVMTANMYTANAQVTLIWTGTAYSSTGATITTSVLESGKLYQIVAAEIFWYDYANNLAADAMYYTTSGTNHWDWVNHFPAPGGHSFLQINGADVNWGPFSNGDTYHTYSITYCGKGAPITFQIVDWMDKNYANNNCHIPIAIYLVEGKGYTPGYWKNHVSAWASTGYSTSQSLSSVFGSAPTGTLIQALRFKGGNGLDGAKQILARAAVAALLNAATFGTDYPYTTAEIKNLVSYEFSSGTRMSILYLATMLDNHNNLET